MVFLKVSNVFWKSERVEVLQDISFTLEEGRSTIIAGTYESGKSVLLKVIGGISPPDKGTVFYYDKDIYDSSDEVIKGIRKEIVFLFHDGALLSNLIIKENLLLPIKYHFPDFIYDEIMNEINEYLDYFGIKNVLEKRPAEVSEISKKLLTFIRAAIMHPRLMLIDEPLFNLDFMSQKKVIVFLENLKKKGINLLIVSNSFDVLKAVGDRLIIMQDGKIVNVLNKEDENFLEKARKFELSDLTGVEDEI